MFEINFLLIFLFYRKIDIFYEYINDLKQIDIFCIFLIFSLNFYTRYFFAIISNSRSPVVSST